MISVIIPAYNEENAIEETIKEIKKVLKKYKGYEIIVVNDGSTDKTREKALKTGVIVIDNEKNMGYGKSLKIGIEHAKNNTIVITDSDLTYPFDKVPEMLEIKKQGYDMVVGARTGKYYKESFFKNILRKLLKLFVEFMANHEIRDINSGLRVFDKDLVSKYIPRLCDTFSFTTSQTLAYMMNGHKVYYIDIPYYKRVGKSKVKLLKYSFITTGHILRAGIYYNPIKIFTLVMILFIIILIIISMIIWII
jgi:glycosyltransferase involved in cell wall biosynthesis